jgi:hypothetical protein
VTTASTSRGARILTEIARGGAILQRTIDHAQLLGTDFADGFLGEALTVAEMERVTLALYDLDTNTYRADGGLRDWESEWYADCLPPPPARLLVPAAGSGREVAALIELGYSVDCFEPVTDFAARCADVNPVGTTLVADYADFCRAVLEDGAGPAATLRDRTYDAVVLGWGSFTHVLTTDAQRNVVLAAARLTPAGPILASFFVRRDGPVGQRRLTHAVARAGGRTLGRLRGSAPAPPRVRLFWNLGFTYSYSEDDLKRLADGADRDLAWWPRPYGHATLTPRIARVS